MIPGGGKRVNASLYHRLDCKTTRVWNNTIYILAETNKRMNDVKVRTYSIGHSFLQDVNTRDFNLLKKDHNNYKTREMKQSQTALVAKYRRTKTDPFKDGMRLYGLCM